METPTESVEKKPFKTPIQNFYKFSFAFKQQLIYAWRPKPTLKCALFCYSIIAAIFIAVGIVLLVNSNSIWDTSIRYDNQCVGTNTPCQVIFEVVSDLIGPVFLQYSITNFYQNHRLYMNSVSLTQLRDQVWYSSDSLSSCSPVITNQDNFYVNNVYGQVLNPADSAFPCGLIARSYFNDTFRIFNQVTNSEVAIGSKGISWPDDLQYNFKNADLSKQWMDVTDERFINWMKISPFTDFKKTWGRIDQALSAGLYRIEIGNRWDSSIFGGEKWVLLTTTNALGSKNYFLAYCYLVIGFLCLLFIIIFVFRKIKRPKGVLEEKLRMISQL